MTEDKLIAYQGLKKQGAVLLRSSDQRYMVVVSTKLPNLMVTIPIRIPVTTSEYRKPISYIPQHYKRPDNSRRQIEYCVENSICADARGIIIFRRNLLMVNIFDLAGYTPNLFKPEPLNIFGSINTIVFE